MSAVTARDPDATTLDSPLFTSPNRLKLGVFHVNCTRGGTPTLAEGSIDRLNWPQQVRIAQAAEAAGVEAIIPIARWRGYGGPSDFNGEQFEAFAWAAGIAAVTSRLLVFSTAHVPLAHPVQVAKEVATVDHISGGRFCLNIVAGWNTAELEMFGVGQREHDDRYAYAGEWTSFLKRLWREETPFDLDGTFFKSTSAISRPQPVQRPRPPIMSAGSSPAGRDFAATHADLCFAAGAFDPDGVRAMVDDIKGRARGHGREVSVWVQVGVLVDDTEREAKRRYEYFVEERGDRDAVRAQLQMLMGGGGQTLDFELSEEMVRAMLSWQSAYPLLGTAEQVVERMVGLTDAGVDGLAMIWVDYEEGLARLGQDVLPLAVQAGIRSAA
jgi:alkanesulfonate monooxygenase SsuD/methylene tetrahydromethanopterin reductase-like flavin-dependent oxidoreductase (luciferase family)